MRRKEVLEFKCKYVRKREKKLKKENFEREEIEKNTQRNAKNTRAQQAMLKVSIQFNQT